MTEKKLQERDKCDSKECLINDEYMCNFECVYRITTGGCINFSVDCNIIEANLHHWNKVMELGMTFSHIKRLYSPKDPESFITILSSKPINKEQRRRIVKAMWR